MSSKRASVHGVVRWRQHEQPYLFQTCLFNSWQWKWLLLSFGSSSDQNSNELLFLPVISSTYASSTLISLVRKWVHTEINHKILKLSVNTAREVLYFWSLNCTKLPYFKEEVERRFFKSIKRDLEEFLEHISVHIANA